MFSPAPSPARLLSLRDPHGAPLADFDWYATLDLLEVDWHGHLTAPSLVLAIQTGLDLAPFAGQRLPRRLLTNHSKASGNWEEALPWLQYDWLPGAQARGLELLAHVVSPDPASHLSEPDQQEFLLALHESMQVRSFRRRSTAWHWLTNR